MGVKPIYKHFEHNGATGPNMATVYSDRGAGVRPPVVFYNRANEAGAMLKSGDFDWKKIFAGGVRWVHSGGIFAALSPTTAPLVAEMMKEAKAAGAITSFDLNFREKLWKISGGDEKAVETIATIVKNVDVLIGNEEDLQKGPRHSRARRAGQVEARSHRVLRHDRQRGKETSAREDRGHHAA